MPNALPLRLPLAALVLMLAGCGRLTLVTLAPPIMPAGLLEKQGVQGCGLDQVAGVVGQPFTALAAYRLPGQLRVLRPGQGVTRDLVPDRLNAQVDEAGVIFRLFCG